MARILEKTKSVVLFPFRLIKKGFVSLQFKLAALFLKHSMKKQGLSSKGIPTEGGQDVDSLKTMVMEFARKSYVGISKNKGLIITMNGQFKVEDVKIDPELLEDPKELRKAIKQAVSDVMQKILGAMMGLTGGSVPSIPGFPGM